METCKTCRFWLRNSDLSRGGTGDQGGGHCRRYPPAMPSGLIIWNEANRGGMMATVSHAGHTNDAWPNVHQQSWCGEHQPRKDQRHDKG